MNDVENKIDEVVEDPAEVLLRQLMHLKKYEVPEASRMTRSKQNIMRQVRESGSKKRWSLGDLLEINIPWFFAEPRYGIALLFVVFAGLQFLGASSRQQLQDRSGIYTSDGNVAVYDVASNISTNRLSYPEFPDNLQLFPRVQPNDRSTLPAVNWLQEQE